MTLLAFSSSTSRASINRQLVSAAIGILGREIDPALDVVTIDLNDFEMPIYSIDRERASGVPEPARSFLAAIASADALLISHAEHNGSYTAAFKNVFDWASRLEAKVFQDKPIVIMATSPGRRGGANVLSLAESGAPRFGARLVGTFSLPRFHEAFDPTTSRLIDDEAQASLKSVLERLVAAI